MNTPQRGAYDGRASLSYYFLVNGPAGTIPADIDTILTATADAGSGIAAVARIGVADWNDKGIAGVCRGTTLYFDCSQGQNTFNGTLNLSLQSQAVYRVDLMAQVTTTSFNAAGYLARPGVLRHIYLCRSGFRGCGRLFGRGE